MHLASLILFLSLLSISYCHSQEIAPGVAYSRITYDNDESFSLHCVTVDPQQASLHLAIAHGKCSSSQTTSSFATEHNALVALNANFFDFGTKSTLRNFFIKILERLGYPRYHAYPMYGCKIDEDWCSLSHVYTGALGWHADGTSRYGTLKHTIILTINGQEYPVGELNKPHTQTPTVYTPIYGQTTPRQRHKTAMEIIVEDGIITTIFPKSHGKKVIPENGFVYVISPQEAESYGPFSINDPVLLTITSSQQEEHNEQTPAWETMDYVLGSTPLLIKNGHIVPYVLERTSDFYRNKHARCAIGTLTNGHWLLVTVDGTPGCTLPQLAHSLQELGCVNALNLCGGRSATMVIQGKVVNTLVSKERPVSTALLVLPNTIKE